MDPIRTPRRAPVRNQDHLGTVIFVVGLLFAAAIVGARMWPVPQDAADPDAQAEVLVPAGETPEPAAPVQSTRTSASARVYHCDGATGAYVLDRPCPVYNKPLPAPRRDDGANPNQALLDAADARYAREVQGAKRAGQQLDRQLAAARDTDMARRHSARRCELLCESLESVRAEMRVGYSPARGQWLHDRQNRLFREMRENDCRACF